MLRDLKRDLESYASLAPEYKREARDADLITVFADKYCKAFDEGDETNKSIYYSCILLKFWNRITDLCQGKDKNYGEQLSCVLSAKKLDANDIFDEVCSCVNEAMKRRTWQDPEKKTNAQACINQIISSRAAGELIRPFNLKKNEGMLFQKSLDESLDGDEDRATVADITYDEVADEMEEGNRAAVSIIQSALDDNKIVEAIIYDHIAFQDCMKTETKKITYIDPETGETKSISSKQQSFWAYQAIRYLSSLDDKYSKYFLNKYSVDRVKFDAAVGALKKANNQKLYRMIDSAKLYGQRYVNL